MIKRENIPVTLVNSHVEICVDNSEWNFHLSEMTTCRFVSIVYPMEYKWLFSQRNALLAILFGYILGLAVSLPTLFPCCHTLWNADYYITVYDPVNTWYYLLFALHMLRIIYYWKWN